MASETYLRNERTSEPVASFFTIAYLQLNPQDPAARPVTFIFNGGPGSSSQWLHMGGFGPKLVVIPGEACPAGAPPYSIVDNGLSLLDVSDLVFIDPIGTGYSRVLGETDLKQYCGLLEDARAVADFVRSWLTDNARWNSPKYLIGESYGAARACLLAHLLAERYIALNGIVLIAAALDYQNSRFRAGDGGILSYVSFLPSYAAVAWYHRRVSRPDMTLECFLQEVRLFARTSFAQALIANEHRLGAAERTDLVKKIAQYSGLSEDYIGRSKLRIPVERFFKELLRDQGLVLGRLDGRYTGVEPDSAGEIAESDPSLDAIDSAFATAVHSQLAQIGVPPMERTYVPMADLREKWNWSLQEKPLSGGGYVNVVPYLGRAMRHNKDLRVLAACGYYDLATPFFGLENALSQDGLVHERISYAYYEVGHMIFLDETSRRKLLQDARCFVSGAEA